MQISTNEIEEILADTTKLIKEDISWSPDAEGSPVQMFRAKVDTEDRQPLIVKGSYNPVAMTLGYALIHKGAGRLYALDLGMDHRNPDGEYVGDRHSHKWEEQWRDKGAKVPYNITADINQPVRVWHQFCKAARIMHEGIMDDPPVAPPPKQLELF